MRSLLGYTASFHTAGALGSIPRTATIMVKITSFRFTDVPKKYEHHVVFDIIGIFVREMFEELYASVENNCAEDVAYATLGHLYFQNEEDMLWFILAWSSRFEIEIEERPDDYRMRLGADGLIHI